MLKFPIDSSIVTICHRWKINLLSSPDQHRRIGCQMSVLFPATCLLPSLRLFRAWSLQKNALVHIPLIHPLPPPPPLIIYIWQFIYQPAFGDHTEGSLSLSLHTYRAMFIPKKPSIFNILNKTTPPSKVLSSLESLAVPDSPAQQLSPDHSPSSCQSPPTNPGIERGVVVVDCASKTCLFLWIEIQAPKERSEKEKGKKTTFVYQAQAAILHALSTWSKFLRLQWKLFPSKHVLGEHWLAGS